MHLKKIHCYTQRDERKISEEKCFLDFARPPFTTRLELADAFLYKTLISIDQSNICYTDLFSIVSNALETALEANLNDAILTNL